MGAADTIAALSTGSLPSGIAIVRVSGPLARFVLETIAGGPHGGRRLVLSTLRGRDGSEIDRGMVAFFAAPASATGEDVAEFHLHGGKAVVARLLEELQAVPGVRLAEAGEFTHRAFLNGRLDLSEAEALAESIDSETEAQRRLASSESATKQSSVYRQWRSSIIDMRAFLEAAIDFSDEGDVPELVSAAVWERLHALRMQIATHLEQFRRAEIVRDGFRVVIAGPPNAGKSSLLNALAGRDVAIVTDVPGTTRDLIEVALDLGGHKVVLTDTAGLRDTADPVESIGIARARQTMADADLVVLLDDMAAPSGIDSVSEPPTAILHVGSKADLVDASVRERWPLAVSVMDGSGIDRLIAAIAARVAEETGSAALLPIRLRHVELLRQADAALAQADPGLPVEVNAEYLRQAAHAIGRITGAVGVEEVLAAIFSRFCIGK